MRAAAIAMLILLLPVALIAAETVGAYFTYVPSQMWYNPTPFEPFKAYIYGHALNCYVNAFEFGLVLPPGIIVQGVEVPEGSLTQGSLPAGLAITYWPPLNGVDPGYNLLCAVNLLALPDGSCGTLVNGMLQVVADGTSGAPTPRQSCWPENTLVPVVGLTSIICPAEIATESASWGAIKSLF